MRLKVFLLSATLFMSAPFAQVSNDKIWLTQPSYTINDSNWNYMKSTLQPKLEQVYEFLNFSDLFNLEVEMHGAIKEPFYQLQRKDVTIAGIPDENGVEKDAVFMYAIGGYYVKGDQVKRLSDEEYLCKVRVDMPINESFDLTYRHTLLPKTLMTEHAMNQDIMDLYAHIIFKNIREICHAAYWGEVEGEFFNSYNEVINHFWKKVRQEVLSDAPNLEFMPRDLEDKIWEGLEKIDKLIIKDDQQHLSY